jgi:hypothetical protein
MPSRLLFDLGATVANGTAVIGGGAGQNQPASSPSQGVITANLASGSGSWVAEIVRAQGASGSVIGSSQGPGIQIPFILLSGEMVQVTVTGATNGVGVIGSVLGTQGWGLSNLPALTAVGFSNENVNATITAPNPYPVSDGGLAESTVALSTQFTQTYSEPLTPGSATTFALGSGQTFPYPSGAAAWQLAITGLNTTHGCRIQWQGITTGLSRFRDTQQGVYGVIVASGIVDDIAMSWTVTLPSGAPSGCIAYLFMCGSNQVQDNFYDTAIYNASFNLPAGTAGYDGALLRVSSTLGDGANATYAMPTYRGPVMIGISCTQALHPTLQESDYLGNLISNDMNLNAVSLSGAGRLNQQVYLPGMNNALVVFNDDSGSTNVFFAEVRATKDLLS